MNIEHTAVYMGPNVWARFPVIQLTLDLGPLEEWPTGRLGTAFQQKLLAALPGLYDHRCSYGVPGGFVRRLTEDEGTWLGHVLEHSSIELQAASGFDVRFGRARSVKGRPGVYHVVYEYTDEDVGLAAGRLALQLLHSLLPSECAPADRDASFDFAAARDEFFDLARSRKLGPSTAAIVEAAERRGIPWERLDGDHLIQFGYGSRQHRIHASLTDVTSTIGVEIAHDKSLTNRLLFDAGIPVPKHVRVHDEDEAVAAAERLGLPVVVKPLDGNQGRGVRPGVATMDDVRQAYHQARAEGSGVLVEEHIRGFDHRMLVVKGELVAASRRVPGHVVGDGKSTIAALVEMVNSDPRRGSGHDSELTRIELDDEAERIMERLGYTPQSVPRAGEEVFLRATANLSRGGTAVDVTNRVHPDNRLMAERAARTVGLDVAGVDFITTDISRSHMEVGGGVNEVNAAPGLRMHLAPSEGRPRDVGEAIIEELFPSDQPATIPIAAITGTNGKTTTAYMVATIATAAGLRAGLTSTNGVYIDGQLIQHTDASGPLSARMVLRDPTVDCAVLETARGGIVRHGLAFRHCNVGAVLNVTEDHLGTDGIDSLEELARIKRNVVDAASDVAVLNADDALCLGMATGRPAKNVCLVSMQQNNPVIEDHIAAGGSALVLDGTFRNTLIYRRGGAHTRLVDAREIPSTHDARVKFSIQNAMFAAAIAIGLGIPLDGVRSGLRAFDSSITCTPGRLNLYDAHPFRVIMDYGHNPAAVRAMCNAARNLTLGGRTICVIAAPGDRRDEDIRNVARSAAGLCDFYICRRDDALRGRGSEEVPLLLRDGLMSAGVPRERIRVVPEEVQAMAQALDIARPNDLLLLFADDLGRTWDQIVSFQSAPMMPDGAVDEGELASAVAGA